MLIPSWNLNPRLLDPTRRNFDLVSGMGLRICIFNNFSGDADIGSPAATWRTTVQAGCVDGMGLPSGVQHSGRAVGGRTYIQDQTGEHLLFAQARLESPHEHGLWTSFNDFKQTFNEIRIHLCISEMLCMSKWRTLKKC